MIHTHEQAIDALCGCAATVTLLSYQEAIEGYLTLRGIEDFAALKSSQPIALAGEAEIPTGVWDDSTSITSLLADLKMIAKNGRETDRVRHIAARSMKMIISLSTPKPAEPAEEGHKSALLNLLAVIHRDGGHKTQEIGWKLAAQQAEQICAELVQRDRALATPAVEALREALVRDAIRFDHCVDMIAGSFAISGTLRAERATKAKHYALEAREALAALTPADAGSGGEG